MYCELKHTLLGDCFPPCSDPYVKISIEGGDELQVFPHFVSLSEDNFPQVYKTSVVSKVVAKLT